VSKRVDAESMITRYLIHYVCSKQYLLSFLGILFNIALVIWHGNTPLLYGNANRLGKRLSTLNGMLVQC